MFDLDVWGKFCISKSGYCHVIKWHGCCPLLICISKMAQQKSAGSSFLEKGFTLPPKKKTSGWNPEKKWGGGFPAGVSPFQSVHFSGEHVVRAVISPYAANHVKHPNDPASFGSFWIGVGVSLSKETAGINSKTSYLEENPCSIQESPIHIAIFRWDLYKTCKNPGGGWNSGCTTKWSFDSLGLLSLLVLYIYLCTPNGFGGKEIPGVIKLLILRGSKNANVCVIWMGFPYNSALFGLVIE